MEDFADEYARGRTPNPCVRCNQWVKFGSLLDLADRVGARRVATGHYARIGGRPGALRLRDARDARKNQVYFLFTLGQEELSRAEFPVGHLTTKARAEWAESRDALRRLDGNAEALDALETALFCVCLDDHTPADEKDACDHLLHGDSGNRWFDKSVSFIVFADGTAGINIEHCGLDGTTVLSFVDTVLTAQPLASVVVPETAVQPDQPQRVIANAAQLLSSLSSFVGVVTAPRKPSVFHHIEFMRLAERRVLLILVAPDGDVQNRVIFTPQDYTDWRARFGNTGAGSGAGSGLGGSAAVPEPASIALVLLGLAAMVARRGRR